MIQMNGATRHIADSVLMVYPSVFYSNPETAASNKFQSNLRQEPNSIAQNEFENLEQKLRDFGVEVLRFESDSRAETPDAVFPNNWISTHSEGQLFLYPMEANNRRRERRRDVVENLQKKYGPYEVFDLSAEEQNNKFLEGTGSLVLDRKNKEAFCCLSSRSHPDVIRSFEKKSGYKVFTFHAKDQNSFPIYHTNVMMAVGESQVLACVESISNPSDQLEFRRRIENRSRNLIEISMNQVLNFCGNILFLQTRKGDRAWFLSQRAFENLESNQIKALEKDGRLVPIAIPTIETLGGGSVRCMIAEIFRGQGT